MVKINRPFIALLAFLGAVMTVLANWNAPVPRGILVNLLTFAALAGAASGIKKEPGATWSRRIVWLACGALLLAAIASIAWMPPWILLVTLGLVASVCRRRSPKRWALAQALGLLALGALLNVYIMGALATRTPMSADPAAYRALDLRAHTLLADVPLHDVWVIDLPGGGEGRSISDLADLPGVRHDRLRAVVPLTLTAIRLGVGWVLRWETEAAADPASSYAKRLTAADRARCDGTCDGDRSGAFGMRTLYTFDREMTREVQNRTVHALLTMALAQADGGYQLFIGIYVKRTSWFTPVYMATVDPFRRLVVYPIGLQALQRRWQAKWGTHIEKAAVVIHPSRVSHSFHNPVVSGNSVAPFHAASRWLYRSKPPGPLRSALPAERQVGRASDHPPGVGRREHASLLSGSGSRARLRLHVVDLRAGVLPALHGGP